MSAQLLSATGIPKEKRASVSFLVLFSLYAIIPICLILQVFDSIFWQRALANSLPSSPSHFLLFQILFGTPHIIASNILLITNGEYFDLYKQKIAVMTLAVAVFFGLGSLFLPYRALYLIVAFWTVFHVLKQQFGISQAICKLPTKVFNLLLILSVVGGFFIYVGIFLKNSLTSDQAHWIKLFAGGFCCALVASALFCQRYAASKFGKAFLWSNVFLVLSSFYLFSQKYYFFAILVPRLVHDTTAYIFYVTHDFNKHHEIPKNFVYRFTHRLRIPIFLVLPLISFSLAFILQAYGDDFINAMTRLLFEEEIRKAVTLGFLGYLGLMHYYTEAFTWKQGSPYRNYIAFSK